MSGVSSGSFSSSLMVICCPLDFASISFSSSLAYVSEYPPGSNFSIERLSTKDSIYFILNRQFRNGRLIIVISGAEAESL
jgi:hypothetical protein